jgi:Na+-transporting NADH:ubiquinone oxidoreductase subunit NqrD
VDPARFGLGAVSSCTPITHGLMNPNWHLVTSTGEFAIKLLRDATPAAVRAICRCFRGSRLAACRCRPVW